MHALSPAACWCLYIAASPPPFRRACLAACQVLLRSCLCFSMPVLRMLHLAVANVDGVVLRGGADIGLTQRIHVIQTTTSMMAHR